MRAQPIVTLDRRTFLKLATTLVCSGSTQMLAEQTRLSARKPRVVKIASDGMVTIDGRREFIQGLYMLPNAPDPWQEVQRSGFNLVHVGADAAELAKAKDHGLYAWASLGSISENKRAEDRARVQKTVMALRDEPALLFWETEDEPTFVWKKTEARISSRQINETARFVRTIDPAHPLYLNHSPTNLVSTLQGYNEGADILAMDIYPVIPPGIREMYALWPDGQQGDLLNSYISQVGQYADKMRQVAGPRRAVFMVLQAFAWENLREKERDPKMVLYPTRQQLRFMAWQSIVHGANGLLWWGLSYTPADAPLWSDLKTIGREVQELRSSLCARKVALSLKIVYHDTGHSVDRGIEWTARQTKAGVVLIAVNADRNPVDVTFEGLERFRECEIMFETRAIQRQGQLYRDSFAPFDAHIYRLS